jgi:peroxiredoxin (alkyl hydroperoxide reductase subunit C)
MDIVVLAISTDTVFSHTMWKETSPCLANVEFPICGDANGAVSRAYGVWQQDSGLTHRAHFLINPKGVILAVEVVTPPLGRSVDDILRQFAALQAVAANPGKAAPANWTPGKNLINTGKDAIGQY